MERNTMFGEHMENKQTCWVYGHDGIMDGNKDYLLDELVNYNQDSVKPREWQEFFNEVYRNRIL